MKATLEFTLPEEDYFFRCSVNARRLDSLLADLDQVLRNFDKYDMPVNKVIEEVRRIVGEHQELRHV